ncbi:MAG: exopolyphosphatase, partial [Planctomycetota bacterium]
MPEIQAPVKTVAAIDIGSNAIRMVLAEVAPDGHVEVLERLQRAVRLGQDTFRRGRLGGQSMRATLGVLKDFRQLLKLYQVERVRAVATSAVREAANADLFLDRVFLATGLHVEVIDTSEESRLTVSAVCQVLGDLLHADHRETLIADVGGGSTLLTLLRGSEIVTSQSLRL